MTAQLRALAIITISIFLNACADPTSNTSARAPNQLATIQVNQIGFHPIATKIAIVPATSAVTFTVVNSTTQAVDYEGKLSAPKSWPPAEEEVKQADFSALTKTGRYVIRVEGATDSPPFVIAETPYGQLHDGAIKAYYFNRASSALTEEYAGKFARPAGHPDTQVMIHSSAASKTRPEGTIISAPKGWYDAGDYNKYIVNSGISTYTLLASYLRFPEFYGQRKWSIPESEDAIPDILNEILWNLEWMQAMQDPEDGGVYHKLTTLNFSDAVMPDKTNAQRYAVAKGTAAALDFAAVMAVAAQVFANFEAELPGKSAAFQQAALRAWAWANANPELPFNNPDDVKTGAYSDNSFEDEFAWAAAELFLLTHNTEFLAAFSKINSPLQTPNWYQVSALGYISLSARGEKLLPPQTLKDINLKIVNAANKLLAAQQKSAYALAMENEDFVWGSNSVALNQAMIALEALRITGDKNYQNIAQSAVDYILGRNPTGYSFVTGFGEKTPMGIHHRQSYADNIDQPIPGWLAGGPHSGQQDDCIYTSKLPAKSYRDDWCSYSTNEIAINWNAPLVYVLASLENHYSKTQQQK